MRDDMVVRTALHAASVALDAEGYAVLSSDLKRADEAMERIMDSWNIKKDLLSKSAVRIVELDQIVSQQSKFGQEQHAYIAQLEAVLREMGDTHHEVRLADGTHLEGCSGCFAHAALEARRTPTGDGGTQ